MKQKILLVVMILLILLNLKLINRPVTENDEGIYTTSFLLVNKGYRLYSQVFFSQLPGFFLTVYPGFLILGKSVQAARFTIYLWSITAVFGLIWLGFQIKKPSIGLLTFLILFTVPSFYKQIVTFQSDALAISFSTLSLVFMYQCINTMKLRYVILSAISMSLAFWTKLDVSILIPVTLILFEKDFSTSKIIARNDKKVSYLLFILTFILISVILTVPFGVNEIVRNVFVLRSQTLSVYPFEPFRVFELFKNDLILSLVIILSMFFFILLRSKIKGLTSIVFLWSIISFCLLFVYRPLFPHHLVFVTVPFVLLFSFLISEFKKLEKYVLFVVICFLLLNFYQTFKIVSNGILSQEQMRGVELIKKYSKPNDFVISDEEILSAESGRLPPPELADLSYVRIKSGNLNSKEFQDILKKYKPRLIVAWNGRLASMNNFEKIMLGNYKLMKLNSRSLYYR